MIATMRHGDMATSYYLKFAKDSGRNRFEERNGFPRALGRRFATVQRRAAKAFEHLLQFAETDFTEQAEYVANFIAAVEKRSAFYLPTLDRMSLEHANAVLACIQYYRWDGDVDFSLLVENGVQRVADMLDEWGFAEDEDEEGQSDEPVVDPRAVMHPNAKSAP